jgi:hypothetical protein
VAELMRVHMAMPASRARRAIICWMPDWVNRSFLCDSQ